MRAPPRRSLRNPETALVSGSLPPPQALDSWLESLTALYSWRGRTLAEEMPLAAESRRTNTLVGAGHVYAIGVDAARSRAPTLVDIQALLVRRAGEARGTRTIVAAGNVDAFRSHAARV